MEAGAKAAAEPTRAAIRTERTMVIVELGIEARR